MLNDAPFDAELITPIVSAGAVILVAIIAAAAGFVNRKRGAVETRAPDANEIWARAEVRERALDYERTNRRHFEDLSFLLWRVFRAYVHRVRHGGTVELTTNEQQVHDTRPAKLEGTSET